jgi:hypothetical protein
VIALRDSRWRELRHAYGEAANVPALLEAIERAPSKSNSREGPWFDLWSALCHQGDVYSASFAAVPHIVRILALAPDKACFDFFLFPASVEVARYRSRVTVPADLASPYRDSLGQIPALAVAASQRDWSGAFGRSILAAVAASKGQYSAAELLLEIEEADDSEVLKWYVSR